MHSTAAMTPRHLEINLMFVRTTRPDAVSIAAAAALTIGGVLIVRTTGTAGWFALLAFTCTAALVVVGTHVTAMSHESDPAQLEVSAWGVRQVTPAGAQEAVQWTELVEVAFVTTNGGPHDEDVYLVLHGPEQSRVVIPQTQAVESGVIAELEERLPDFDNTAYVNAMASNTEGVFSVWRAADRTTD
jgi:hypothetical protein